MEDETEGSGCSSKIPTELKNYTEGSNLQGTDDQNYFSPNSKQV